MECCNIRCGLVWFDMGVRKYQGDNFNVFCFHFPLSFLL